MSKPTLGQRRKQRRKNQRRQNAPADTGLRAVHDRQHPDRARDHEPAAHQSVGDDVDSGPDDATPSRMRRVVATAVVPAGAAVAGWLAGPSLTRSSTDDAFDRWVGTATFAAIAVTVKLYLLWRRRLGTATAVVAVSLMWGSVGAMIAVAPPQCPGRYAPGRCGTADIASWVAVGMMFPVALAVIVSAPLLIVVAIQRIPVLIGRRPGRGRR
jgi:hypothetical protein